MDAIPSNASPVRGWKVLNKVPEYLHKGKGEAELNEVLILCEIYRKRPSYAGRDKADVESGLMPCFQQMCLKTKSFEKGNGVQDA